MVVLSFQDLLIEEVQSPQLQGVEQRNRGERCAVTFAPQHQNPDGGLVFFQPPSMIEFVVGV